MVGARFTNIQFCSGESLYVVPVFVFHIFYKDSNIKEGLLSFEIFHIIDKEILQV